MGLGERRGGCLLSGKGGEGRGGEERGGEGRGGEGREDGGGWCVMEGGWESGCGERVWEASVMGEMGMSTMTMVAKGCLRVRSKTANECDRGVECGRRRVGRPRQKKTEVKCPGQGQSACQDIDQEWRSTSE